MRDGRRESRETGGVRSFQYVRIQLPIHSNLCVILLDPGRTEPSTQNSETNFFHPSRNGARNPGGGAVARVAISICAIWAWIWDRGRHYAVETPYSRVTT